MKTIKFLTIILISAVLFSCGKKDETPKVENQNSTQNLQQKSEPPVQNNVDNNGKKWWIGQYVFEESAKNVTGKGAQTWNYVVDVKQFDANTLVATIQVDGFQTMQRLEAKVNATAYDIEFIFDKYGKDNMFEPYKKGDRLFSMMRNTQDEIMTVWDKLKPNVINNQESGKIMFRKLAS
jgi:hypothetical protein